MSERARTLSDLHADPALAAVLSEPERLRLLAAAEGVVSVLRLARSPRADADAEANAGGGPATVEQAAEVVGLTVQEFYRRKAFRPAIIRLGHRTRRVDMKKLGRILAGLWG